MRLTIERISKRYGATAALREVTLELGPGFSGWLARTADGADIARSPDSLPVGR